MNTNNQLILTYYVQMKSKTSLSGINVSNINIDELKQLSDFVNNKAVTPESGLAALEIACANAGGLTSIADIIAAAEKFDAFLNEPATAEETVATSAIAPVDATVTVQTSKK